MSKMLVIGIMVIMLTPSAAWAADITLQLLMPGTMFQPGSPVYCHLGVANEGSDYPGAQVYVALSLGTGDFWFYPNWVQYPPQIDWEAVDLAGHSTTTLTILPQFVWPSGTGEFSGAMFFAAVLHAGNLISNVAEYTFSWSDAQENVWVGPMVSVAAGSFTQGAPSWEPCPGYGESQFTHHLVRNLAVMETEVSRQMWADLGRLEPTLPYDRSYPSISPTMSHPVQMVMWYDALLFANLLSVQNGYTRCYYTDPNFLNPIDSSNFMTGPFFCNFNANGYRLPTEGEWEYLARAGTSGPFSCDEGNYNDGNCESCSGGTHWTLEQYSVFCANAPGATAPVGSKQANPWGLKDLHGNVWEWCWDYYEMSYPGGDQTDYQGPASGWDHVRRGGGWNEYPRYCRSANRAKRGPNDPRDDLGFRLVRTVP